MWIKKNHIEASFAVYNFSHALANKGLLATYDEKNFAIFFSFCKLEREWSMCIRTPLMCYLKTFDFVKEINEFWPILQGISHSPYLFMFSHTSYSLIITSAQFCLLLIDLYVKMCGQIRFPAFQLNNCHFSKLYCDMYMCTLPKYTIIHCREFLFPFILVFECIILYFHSN